MLVKMGVKMKNRLHRSDINEIELGQDMVRNKLNIECFSV